MGRRCVEEVLKKDPNRVLELFVTHKKKRSLPPSIIERAKAACIPVTRTDKDTLTSMASSAGHQGIIASLRARTYGTMATLLAEVREGGSEGKLFVLCDEITDPRNFGALLRVAECFSVDGVIFSKNRTAPVTPVTAKASTGASELVPLFSVSNTGEAVRRLRKVGFEAVVADVTGEAVPLNAFSFSERTVLIVGREGKGIRPLLRNMADKVVTIPLFGEITSLNVAQATSIFLYKARFPG